VWCDDGTTSKLLEDVMGGERVLTYPRNISDIYKGTWKFDDKSNPESVGFLKKDGHTWFALKNSEFSKDVDLVHGDMVVRDGVYSTDENMRFSLYGAYFHHRGSALLLANPIGPVGNEVLLPANFSIISNMSISDAYWAADKIITDGLSTFNTTFGKLCPFRLNLQMHPLPSKLDLKPDLIGENRMSSPENNYTTGGTFVSLWCNVAMEINAGSVHLSDYLSKWINYVVMVSLSSFVQILVLIKQMEYTGTQAGASKMSLLTVGAQAVLDVYLCLIHLVAGILIESMFSAFVTAAFFQFVTFLVFEMRYLMVILKARRPQAFAEGWIALRREFSLFYLRFYTFVVGGFILIFYMSDLFYIFVFLMHSFWVPQIICNAQKCARRPMLWQYIIGMSVTRLSIPLYFYGCPHNFLIAEPNYKIAFLLSAYMALQVAVLYLQEKRGPQFFVPKMFLPVKYDYGRPLNHGMSEDQRNCVICMREVEVYDPDHMITPCDHIFHAECLMQWLDVKLECPTCRRPLPAP